MYRKNSTAFGRESFSLCQPNRAHFCFYSYLSFWSGFIEYLLDTHFQKFYNIFVTLDAVEYAYRRQQEKKLGLVNLSMDKRVRVTVDLRNLISRNKLR